MLQKIKATKRQIVLFGAASLQNSVLVGHIQQQLSIDCIFQKNLSWPELDVEDQSPVLALVDSEFSKRESFLKFLELIHSLKKKVNIAFYGVKNFELTEKYVIWPNVVGIFRHDTTQFQFCRGIESIFSGEVWLPRKILSTYLLQTRKLPKVSFDMPVVLTRREKEILRLAATGATNTEIALALCVSKHTIKTHMYNIFKKLAVENRVQAVNWAKDYIEEISNPLLN